MMWKLCLFLVNYHAHLIKRPSEICIIIANVKCPNLIKNISYIIMRIGLNKSIKPHRTETVSLIYL